MNRTEKTAQIAAAKENFDRAISVALINFQGLSVEAVTTLRREFRKAKIEYRVLKNTVLRHALKEGPYNSLVGDLSPERKNGARANAVLRGMTAVAWSYEDPAAAIKVIDKFKKDFGPKAEKLTVKTGLVSGSVISGEALGKMPGLKETQAQIVGLMLAPAAQIYTALVAPGAMIAAILEAHVAKQSEGAGEGGGA